MTEREFWAIVEASRKGAGGRRKKQEGALRKELNALPPAEIEDFERIWGRLRNDAYHWDL